MKFLNVLPYTYFQGYACCISKADGQWSQAAHIRGNWGCSVCFEFVFFHAWLTSFFQRYIYQPMDNLYILLITNRASNIVEDLETLRLLSKGSFKLMIIFVELNHWLYSLSLLFSISMYTAIPSVAGVMTNLSEEQVQEKAFDLIFAFDEVWKK